MKEIKTQKNNKKYYFNVIWVKYTIKRRIAKIPNDTMLNELKTKISKELYYELDDKLDNKKKIK